MSKFRLTYWLLAGFFLLSSCRNYETEAHFAAEDEVYRALLGEFTDMAYMLSVNDYGEGKPTLYVISDLFNEVEVRIDTITYATEIGSNGLPSKLKSEVSKQSLEERKLFKPLVKAKLARRKLDFLWKHDSLNIQLLPEAEYQAKHEEDTGKIMENDRSIFGYLHLSRIAFNRDLTKGYMAYSFFCGVACAWYNHIEVVKENGQWKISRTFSGGIA